MKSATEIRKQVTAEIIKALESGRNPWRKPWTPDQSAIPHNCATGHAYRGMNPLYLEAVQMNRDYATSQWLTYNQARKLGGHVIKGAKSAMVLFTKPIKIRDKDTDEKKMIHMLRCFTVFNIADTEGCKLPARETPEDTRPVDPKGAIDAAIAYLGMADIKLGGDSAGYAPKADVIHLPRPETFTSAEGFAATAYHELVHWSGASKRLQRAGIVDTSPYGSEKYAFEELIAEIGAAMLCQKNRVSNEIENHASYIESWLKALESNERFIFEASRAAESAFNYIEEQQS